MRDLGSSRGPPAAGAVEGSPSVLGEGGGVGLVLEEEADGLGVVVVGGAVHGGVLVAVGGVDEAGVGGEEGGEGGDVAVLGRLEGLLGGVVRVHVLVRLFHALVVHGVAAHEDPGLRPAPVVRHELQEPRVRQHRPAKPSSCQPS